jgi:predicted GIY-YIG superfamily endonuclease
MEIGYVYWIHLKDHTDPTEEGYIGVTSNLDRRFKEHKKSKNPILLEAMKSEEIVMDILFVGSYKCAFLREKCFRPKKNIGWNIASGGSAPPNQKGVPKSLETRKKMSQNNVGMKGKKHSEETKAKYREDRKNRIGTPHTEETKRKLSEIAKNRKHQLPGMSGKKHSEETKRKISESSKRWRNEQTK